MFQDLDEMFLSYKKLNQIKMQRKKDLDKFNNDLQSTKQQFDNKLENYQGIIKQQVKLVLPYQVSSLIFFFCRQAPSNNIVKLNKNSSSK